MSLYKRGNVWWYKIKFAGQTIRESTKSSSFNVARDAQRARRRELEEGFNGIRRESRAKLFKAASEAWLASKKLHLAPQSIQIEKYNLSHLLPAFGKKLLTDITADDITAYQAERLDAGAAAKTVNLEVGTLRAILRRNRIWANLQPDVKMLKVSEDVGRALTPEEERTLLLECSRSRSRHLFPAVVLALSTGMRYSEIRLLQWHQVDFEQRLVKVGKSKTDAGTGRVIPLTSRALLVLKQHSENYPKRRREHYIFPAEKYGIDGNDRSKVKAYEIDPTHPIGDWKEAWEAAKSRANVEWCRFHDLRHTACTRLLEANCPFATVATIMGWSASTAVRMAKRYGHISQESMRTAIRALDCELILTAGEGQRVTERVN